MYEWPVQIVKSSNNSDMVGSMVDHLMYADDCMLFSLSSAGLQQLLSMFF